MDFLLHDHDTLATLRRMVFHKLKTTPSNIKLELFVGSDVLDTADDKKILALLPVRDKSVLTAKLSQIGTGAGASSPDSSSDSSGGSPQHAAYDGTVLRRRGGDSSLLTDVVLQVPMLRVSSVCQG